jgi:hypothetical protein
MLKKILLLLLVVLIVIQFFHSPRNKAEGAQANYIGNVYPVPADVKSILGKACNDCHSNNTRYPWYSNIQPVDWWLKRHIDEGKKELDFDEFMGKSPRYQYNKMKASVEMIKTGKMPLNSYLWIHKDAKLTVDEKNKLMSWFMSVQDSLKAKYPMDSLIRKQPPQKG